MGATFKAPKQAVQLKETKELRDYQKSAIANVIQGLGHADRGKLIMACSTGKTFSSLRLAEQMAGTGGRVLFLVPSLSLLSQTLDVVQSAGRVMHKPRTSTKQLGYVLLPAVIPADMLQEDALNDNKTYKVVWEVLQALRSHDDRFDTMINKLDLTGQDRSKMEVIAITDTINIKRKAPPTGDKPEVAKINIAAKSAKAAKGGTTIGEAVSLEYPSSMRVARCFFIQPHD